MNSSRPQAQTAPGEGNVGSGRALLYDMPRTKARALDLAVELRIVLAVGFWLLLHLYAGRPLLVTAHLHGIAPAAAWTGLVLLTLFTTLPFILRRGERTRLGTAFNWAAFITMSVFSLLFVLVFAADILRALYWIAGVALTFATLPPISSASINLGILGAAAVLTIVGLFQARRPRVRRVAISIVDLPAQLEGFRIVQLSDVHIGPTIRSRFVASLVERTNELKPDAIAITGDLVDGRLDHLREQARPLAGLEARHGVFYVTGNHEYYWDADAWVAEFRTLGLTFLKNEHRTIEHDGARVVFAGVTDPAGRGSHKPDPAGALAGADGVKILLSHRPQTANAAEQLGVDLQLSGHTHGGQFFPFSFLIRYFQPVVAGLSRIGQTWLYVSRGTGYWGPPTRLGVGGEITLLILRTQNAERRT